jgi:septum formation protein
MHKKTLPLPLVLGSRSASRAKVLKEYGYEFETLPVDIDEEAVPSPTIVQRPLIVAKEKMQVLKERCADRRALLLTGDSIVEHNGTLFEKPKTHDEALEMLQTLKNSSWTFITGLCVYNTTNSFGAEEISPVSVRFGDVPDWLIEAAASEDAALTRAGAIAIEEERWKPYVVEVNGSIESVQGFPIDVFEDLLELVVQDKSDVE